MDFILIKGDSAEEIEEKGFTYAVNMSTKAERLRNFIGLENTNLLRIVMISRSRLPDSKGSRRPRT